MTAKKSLFKLSNALINFEQKGRWEKGAKRMSLIDILFLPPLHWISHHPTTKNHCVSPQEAANRGNVGGDKSLNCESENRHPDQMERERYASLTVTNATHPGLVNLQSAWRILYTVRGYKSSLFKDLASSSKYYHSTNCGWFPATRNMWESLLLELLVHGKEEADNRHIRSRQDCSFFCAWMCICKGGR